MVRAILEGRKTQTRRVVKPRKGQELDPSGIYEHTPGDLLPCPYGAVGDRLWVRESWAMPHGFDLADSSLNVMREKGKRPMYRATDNRNSYMWRSPLFMPRWASRLILGITEVRVERVQDIGLDGYDKEGTYAIFDSTCDANDLRANRGAFMDVWDSIYKNCCFRWEANPWVWVITFKVVTDEI